MDHGWDCTAREAQICYPVPQENISRTVCVLCIAELWLKLYALKMWKSVVWNLLVCHSPLAPRIWTVFCTPEIVIIIVFLTCIWPSWCQCHSLSLASVKSRLVLPFWYRPTRVVPDKGPLNVCVRGQGVVMSCGLEGDHRSGIVLTCTKCTNCTKWFVHLWLSVWGREMSTPPALPLHTWTHMYSCIHV